MSRKIGILLFAFFCYLLWLSFAIYESSIDNWRTVNEIKQETGDTVQIGISFIKVFAGTIIFTLSGSIFYLLLRRRFGQDYP